MLDANNFISRMASIMEAETIYIKEVENLTVVYYRHYKEDSVFFIIKDKSKISIFRNEIIIMSFEMKSVKRGIKILDDMLNAFAVYIAINYDNKKTVNEIKKLSSDSVIEDSFNCLFRFKKNDIDITLIRFDIKKE